MADTPAQTRRCPECGRETSLNSRLRLHECRSCRAYFYYNFKEKFGFGRSIANNSSALQALAEAESQAWEKVEQGRESGEAELKTLKEEAVQLRLTSRVLVVSMLVLIVASFFLAGQIDLHSFSQPSVIILLLLFGISSVLIFFQIRGTASNRRALKQQYRQLLSLYDELFTVQRGVDLRVIATSIYVGAQRDEKV